MADQIDFDEQVRDHIWTILNRKYNTVRRGGHPVDADEHLRERTFWPDMLFDKVESIDGPDGRQLQLIFVPANQPDMTFGYKIDVDKAASAWSERVGIREPRKNSSMFAAELIWYMVAYIGSTDIESCVEDEHGVRWINTGSDVFKPLPDADSHHH